MRAVKDSLAVPLMAKWENRKTLARAMARLGVPVGGRVRTLRAVGDSSGPSQDKVNEQAWKNYFRYLLRPCLGQGASRRARVGRVRRLVFLSILQRWSILVVDVHAIEIPLGWNGFSAAC